MCAAINVPCKLTVDEWLGMIFVITKAEWDVVVANYSFV